VCRFHAYQRPRSRPSFTKSRVPEPTGPLTCYAYGVAFNDKTNMRVKGRFDATKHWQRPLMHSKDAATCRQDVAPPGFEGTVKAMKKHEEINNPWALAWYMKNAGDVSHK
jgi:hypothetical protein